ncbi:MAG: histidine kinase N-terminal 7TM domain-containing protein [Anaerolineae bacterium]
MLNAMSYITGQLLLYTALLAIAAIIAGVLAVYTWRRRPSQVAYFFAFMMTAVSLWAMTSLLEQLSKGLATKLFWARAAYLGITTIPLGWIGFVLAYTGRGRYLTVRNLALLTIHPVLTLVFAWGNPFHLFYREIALDTTRAVPMLMLEKGLAFWIHTLYAYGVLLAGSYLLLRSRVRGPDVYRRQTLFVMISVVVPWAANVISIFDLVRPHNLDLTPFAFTISGVAIAWGLLRHRLFDLMPLARDAIMESLRQGLIVLDREDRIVDVNPAAEEMTAHRRRDVVGQVLGDVLPAYAEILSHYEDRHEAYEEVFVSGPKEDGYPEGDSSVSVYEVHVYPLLDAHGHLAGRLLVVQDITEYKRSETALSNYAERLRILHEIDQAILAAQSPEKIAVAALDQMHDLLPAERMSVVVLNDQSEPELLAMRTNGTLSANSSVWQATLESSTFQVGEIQCVNEMQACEEAGSLADHLYLEGVRAYLMVPLVLRDIVIGALNLEATSEGVFTQEHVDVVSQVATSLAVALQNAGLYAAAQQELAERKAAEAALRASEQSLREKAEDLAARNAELDAFAHTVAHDLKAPLALLIGYTTFLEADDEEPLDDESIRRSIHAIEESARKMSDIVDELLLLASVRKREEVDVAPLDMEVIVSDVLDRLSDLVDRRHAVIKVPKTWPIAMGYGPWVEEVWANYISNAIKYGGDPPRIELGATPAPDHHDGRDSVEHIRFWVRDNGSGLTEAEQARLFIPFERLEQARVEGYGLGLSIVQRIMEKLDGDVGVESEGVPGEGSCFWFELPKAQL